MVQAGVADYDVASWNALAAPAKHAAGGDRPLECRRQRGAEDARGARAGCWRWACARRAARRSSCRRCWPARSATGARSSAPRRSSPSDAAGPGMDLKQLEYFVQVAEFGSFTLSSRFLRVAQPALSRQVRALEVELRQTLFERNGRGVTLTEPGKRLLEHARGILQQVQRARLDLEQQRGAVSGRLVIGLPPSVSRTLTGPLVRAFRERFPARQLRRGRGPVRPPDGMAGGRAGWISAWSTAARAPASIELVPLRVEPMYLVGARPAKAGARLVGAPVSAGAGGGHRAGDPAAAAFDPHAARFGAGRCRPEGARGAGDRKRAHHPGPGAARRLPCGADAERHPPQRQRERASRCGRSASRGWPPRCAWRPRRSARPAR